MEKFWFKERLNRVSIAIMLAVLCSLVISFFLDTEGDSLVKRGDFPGFYVLAVIKKMGLMGQLYDPALQRSVENQFWPSFDGSFYMSAYPAYVATFLYPLAFLSPFLAQCLFSVFMCICLVCSVILVSKINRTLAEHLFPATVFTFCFTPLFFASFGAQNTGLSMLLYAAVIYLISKDSKASDFMAGVAAGLWLFKPQFAVFIFALLLAGRLWFSVLGFAITASLLQLIAAMDMGFFWFGGWIKTLQAFSEQNFISNSPQIVSLQGTIKAAAYYLGMNNQSPTMPLISLAASCLVMLIMVIFLLKVFTANRKQLPELFILFGPVMTLLSPQTLFYDLGIGFVPLLCLLNFREDSAIWKIIGLNLASFVVVMYRESLPVPLFFLFAIYLFMQVNSSKKEIICPN